MVRRTIPSICNENFNRSIERFTPTEMIFKPDHSELACHSRPPVKHAQNVNLQEKIAKLKEINSIQGCKNPIHGKLSPS